MSEYHPVARKPLFFMHIPKTAGTSLRLYLENQYLAQELYPPADMMAAVRSVADPADFLLIRGHFTYNMSFSASPGSRVLTVLREPMARTLSLLRHLKRDPTFHPLHDLAKEMTISQMLRDDRIMALNKDVQGSYLCASASLAEIRKYISNAASRGETVDASDIEDPPTLELAKERLKSIPLVGTVEALHLLLADLEEEMSYSSTTYFPTLNYAPDKATSLQGLRASDIAILRAYNEIDIPLYEFASNLVRQRRFERSMRRLITQGAIRVPGGSFAIDLSEPVPGSGWFEAEEENGVRWRWTGPSRYFTLELPLRSDGSYAVELGFVHPPSWKGPLSVTVNGEPLPTTVTKELGRMIFRFAISAETLTETDGICRLVFDTLDTAMPEGDLRTLGVCVSSIHFHYKQ